MGRASQSHGYITSQALMPTPAHINVTTCNSDPGLERDPARDPQQSKVLDNFASSPTAKEGAPTTTKERSALAQAYAYEPPDLLSHMPTLRNTTAARRSAKAFTNVRRANRLGKERPERPGGDWELLHVRVAVGRVLKRKAPHSVFPPPRAAHLNLRGR